MYSRRGCFLLFLFVFSVFVNVKVEVDLTIFNETLVHGTNKSFNTQVTNTLPNEYRRLVSRMGKIAFFTRLIRQFAQSPNVGIVDFEYYFPKPEMSFHHKVYEHCNQDITKCVNFIFENIRARAPFLFPIKGQQMRDFNMTKENFKSLFTNNLFQFDVTVSYLFCFLSTNRLEVLEKLPFCSYNASDDKNNVWPADRYKELSEHAELILEPGQDYEIIDELTSQPDFTCAERSFCPNPCCGFKDSTNGCTHPICQNSSLKMLCSINNKDNSNLIGMVANSWNASCSCDNTAYVFRFDVKQCVIGDGCAKKSCSPDKNEECMNTIAGPECVCQAGYLRNQMTAQCGLSEVYPPVYFDLNTSSNSSL